MKAHINNQRKLLKSSITLIETLVSLILLSTIAIGFSKLRYDKSSNIELFDTLNRVENLFTTNNYSNFKIYSTNITIIKLKEKSIEKESLNVQKYRFISDNIEVYKYEK